VLIRILHQLLRFFNRPPNTRTVRILQLNDEKEAAMNF